MAGTSFKTLIDSITGVDNAAADIPDKFLGSESPKLPFNWTISFVNRANVDPTNNTPSMVTNTFAVKTADRPKPTIEYQDINVYNYRTKVAVRVDYGTVSVSFYDDMSNRAQDILANYLNIVSPISQIPAGSADSLDNLSGNSTIGPLQNKLGPLNSITLTHYYQPNGTLKSTAYSYLNPKFVNIDFGSLDMTQSDASIVTVSFNFDSVYILKG